jgi:hypothetical protein
MGSLIRRRRKCTKHNAKIKIAAFKQASDAYENGRKLTLARSTAWKEDRRADRIKAVLMADGGWSHRDIAGVLFGGGEIVSCYVCETKSLR